MSELKLYRAKLKTRKQIMAEIPREQQGWWADVCAGETLYLRDATEADLERCNLGASAPRNVHEYLCENIERGSLVRRIAIAELTEIPERGLVAHHNESVRLTARIQELEAELARRTQPEATKPAQDVKHAKCSDGGECGVGGYCDNCHAQKLTQYGCGLGCICTATFQHDECNADHSTLRFRPVAPAQDLGAAVESALSQPYGWVQFIDGVKTQNFARDEKELNDIKTMFRLMKHTGKAEYLPLYASPAQALSAVDSETVRDAERYRWIRENGNSDAVNWLLDSFHSVTELMQGEELDTTIDAILQSQGTKNG